MTSARLRLASGHCRRAECSFRRAHWAIVLLGPTMLANMADMPTNMPTLACEALAKLKRPTLLVTGERSPAMFLMVTAELERCLEGERQVMVPDAGHGLHLQNPDFYNQAVMAFLQRR